jgi:DNA-binding SARP family transcriptional activator/tetratricopeptide (TPR) repeat protein
MRFALLGPLAVADGAGDPVALAGPRLRVLLAALLLHANIPVPADGLAELVWDGSPPSGAVATLRSYVRRLRGAVDPGSARIAFSGPGYVIRVEPAELDILEFEALCRDSRTALRAGHWAAASAAAARALGLWRAAPLLDVPAEALRDEFVPRLERLRLQVLEDRFDAGLRLGQHQELIPELLDVTARHPLQERLQAQLMLALASAGRRAQALDAYQRARAALVAELGIEPGSQLRDIHRQILAGDAALASAVVLPSAVVLGDAVPMSNAVRTGDLGPMTSGADDRRAAAMTVPVATSVPVSAAGEPAGPAPGVPAQLPAGIADFTGRQSQAASLYEALASPWAGDGPGTVPVVVVAGAAGLGKTTLAVHVAHQVRHLFPDGQLYVNLSGASGQPARPAEVLARFLRDLGVDGDKIPAGDEERAALFRTLLADRRVLVLLDDAAGAAQVRPLLPGSAFCGVLVTTRNRTPQVVSTDFVDLEVLPEPEALELFARIAGDARLAAEPEAAAEILRACAGLPLAVRICAARLATRRQWKVATMAARLRDERRLDELRIGDLEVRASFQVSYDGLRTGRPQADPRRAFRLLGLWPGQQISLPAAAALTGEREPELAGLLEALVDANLLESPEPDRYQLHDLLRLFAAERAQAEETESGRCAAVTRLLQWYLATATAAADLLNPPRYRLPPDEPSPAGPAPQSAQGCLDWYDREHPNLLTAIRQAAATGQHEIAWRLPVTVFELFGRRHNWADCVTAHRIAVTSADTCGSRLGKAWALHNLGYGLARVGDAEAFSRLQESYAIRHDMSDLGGEAQAAIALMEAYYRIQGPQAAYAHSPHYLDLIRRAGNPWRLAIGLNNHGHHCELLGKVDEATRYLQEALGILESIGGGPGLAEVLANLGRIHLKSGRFDEAIAGLTEAHRLYLGRGQLLGQAVVLRELGEAQHRVGAADQARESLEAALALFRQLKDEAEVEETRSLLAAPARPAG